MSVFVPLALDPFIAFVERRKVYEVRRLGSPVARQVLKARTGDEVVLRWGYGPHGEKGILQCVGALGDVWCGSADEMPDRVKAGAALTPGPWKWRYFDPNGDVLCFRVDSLDVPEGLLAKVWSP